MIQSTHDHDLIRYYWLTFAYDVRFVSEALGGGGGGAEYGAQFYY